MSLPIALILAGGVGKRMRPLEENKVLIRFLGKPFFEYVLDDILKSGINKIIVVVNPDNQLAIEKILKKKPVDFKICLQSQAKGMADAVLISRRFIQNKPLLIINANDLYQSNIYKDFVKQIKNQKFVLSGLKVSSYLPGGYFKLIKNRVIGLVEKPGEGKEPSSFFKPVIDYFQDPKVFINYLLNLNSYKDDLYEIALDKLINDQKAGIFRINSFFQQLKYPWHVLGIMEKILKLRLENKISRKSEISPRAVIKGPVIIEEGVKVLEGAVIQGPSFIGKNTIVGNNVLVRDSNISENCVIGYNTEIARSWIGPDSWFHGNFIGDSVIEGKVNFGSGAKTANLRLDEEEIFVKEELGKLATGRNKLGAIVGRAVKVGINACLMPGVLIDKDCLVGPGVVLNQNLSKNQFCYQKGKLAIKKRV